MSPNYIKQFIDEYKDCPLCGATLDIHAAPPGTSNMCFSVYVASNELTIKVTTNYFVNPKENEFRFTISIRNGQIIYGELANEFVSLYDLNIILSKDCQNCRVKNKTGGFYRSINLFYDRSESVFSAVPHIEWFAFCYDKNYYAFLNNYVRRESDIFVFTSPAQLLPVSAPSLFGAQKVRHVPFEKFDFRDASTLYGKINAIQLLI